MITLKNINKGYATPRGWVQALSDINLQVDSGHIFGVIGASGAGKSTLLRCVNLLEQPSSGQVCVDGQWLTSLPPAQLRRVRRQMGMIFQHFNLLSTQTVFENVALPLRLIGVKRSQWETRVAPLLELTGLTQKRSCYPAQLSGGQKQRVAIARALVTQPKVLLCDEATSALDPSTTKSILQLLSSIQKEMGLTILLITHEMAVIKAFCQDVAVLDAGSIVEQGPVVDIFTHPRSPAAKAMIQSCLHLQLPEDLSARLMPKQAPGLLPILQFQFRGHVAAEPLIYQLVKHYDLRVNILQGNIETVAKETLGHLIVRIDPPLEKLQQGMDYLRDQGIGVEVLGHVEPD